MVADAILDSTKLNDIVLDPFLGSGTTLLAAERTSRRCRAIELDPLYVDTAILRWERLTGRKARHASGQTFAEVRDERGVTP
jgi:DNA modification methylase